MVLFYQFSFDEGFNREKLGKITSEVSTSLLNSLYQKKKNKKKKIKIKKTNKKSVYTKFLAAINPKLYFLERG